MKTSPKPSLIVTAFTKIGTFSDALMAGAGEKKRDIISMKSDWKKIFAFEQ